MGTVKFDQSRTWSSHTQLQDPHVPAGKALWWASTVIPVALLNLPSPHCSQTVALSRLLYHPLQSFTQFAFIPSMLAKHTCIFKSQHQERAFACYQVFRLHTPLNQSTGHTQHIPRYPLSIGIFLGCTHHIEWNRLSIDTSLLRMAHSSRHLGAYPQDIAQCAILDFSATMARCK